MSVVLSEHLPLLATAPDGIQKLRGLILELAVRGKLVPQDPNDEPASELLKRIAQERARIGGGPTRRKNKQTPLSDGESWPFAIPDGWKWSRLSDLTQVLNGRAYSKDELLEAGTPVLRVGNLFTSNHWYYSNLTLEPEKYCEEGDLIYSWSASFGPFIWSGPKVIYHYHIWKLALFDETSCSKAFLYKFLLEKTAEIKAAGHGVSMVHMTKEKMEKLPVPVPPLPEQHRIVAKVDELMALCDRLEAEQADAEAAHALLVDTLLGTLTQSTDAADLAANWQRLAEHFDTLFTTESSLDALKQTILQLAVMGKLVPQDPNDEPASELLRRIAQERARLEAEGTCKKSKSMPLVGEDERPFDAPKAWQWQRLDELLVISGGVTLGRKLSGRELISAPYLRVANVQRGHLQLEHMKTIEVPADELGKYRLQSNDLLITEGGDWDKVGRTAIWRGEIDECLHQNHVFRARPIGDDWNCSWTEMYLNARPARDYFAASSKQTTNLASINMTQLKACPFPVPPLAEQRRIVAKVDELMALCDRLKGDLAESRSRQERLASTLIESALDAA